MTSCCFDADLERDDSGTLFALRSRRTLLPPPPAADCAAADDGGVARPHRLADALVVVCDGRIAEVIIVESDAVSYTHLTLPTKRIV